MKAVFPRRTRRVVPRVAVTLALTAKTDQEFRAAHKAMRAAYPGLARAYPCDCQDCRGGEVTPS